MNLKHVVLAICCLQFFVGAGWILRLIYGVFTIRSLIYLIFFLLAGCLGVGAAMSGKFKTGAVRLNWLVAILWTIGLCRTWVQLYDESPAIPPESIAFLVNFLTVVVPCIVNANLIEGLPSAREICARTNE